MIKCYSCKNGLESCEVSMGMNMPNVTPGPVYFCAKCVPIGTSAEIVESLDNFVNPPKERSINA